MYLRFSHVVACVNNLLFLSPRNSPLYGCTTIYPLNQWKTFRLFLVWGDYRYAAINILKQVFVWNICFHFSRENTNDKYLFYFIRICQCFQSGCFHSAKCGNFSHSVSLSGLGLSPLLPPSLTSFLFFFISNFSHSNWTVVVSDSGLICIFSMVSNFELFKNGLVYHPYIFFGKMYIQPFAYLVAGWGGVCFLIVEF